MLLITCPPGLAQITKKELAYLGYKSQVQGPANLIVEEDNESAIAKLNLRLRTANKISLVVDSGQATTFDELFDLVFDQPWDKIISEEQAIVVEASTYQSQLSSVPTIQKIVKKAIAKKLMNGSNDNRKEDHKKGIIFVSVMLHSNKAVISLNSSGDSLHKRGYRVSTGDAPIKETIAAGLVISSGWKFHEIFLDPCCGSGTIPIEAAMIAKNIAPGLHRKFAFEDRVWYPKSYLVDEKATAKGRQIKKDHMIIASDIDPEMITKAKQNAKKLGLEDSIQWDVKPCQEYMTDMFHGKELQKDLSSGAKGSDSEMQSKDPGQQKNNGILDGMDSSGRQSDDPIKLQGTMVTNPPYGLRMLPDDIADIHTSLFALAEKNDLSGGIVTAYIDAARYCKNPHRWTTMIIKNGAEDTTFWKKKEK